MAKQISRQEASQIKRRRWQAHIQAWQISGLHQNEYCRQHRLSSSQFCYWKKKLKKPEKSVVDFVPVPACISQQAKEESSNSSGLTIIIDANIRIRLEKGFSTRSLASALSVLRP